MKLYFPYLFLSIYFLVSLNLLSFNHYIVFPNVNEMKYIKKFKTFFGKLSNKRCLAIKKFMRLSVGAGTRCIRHCAS